MTPIKQYYYEKRYIRKDGQVLVRKFNRSFSYGQLLDPLTGEYQKPKPEDFEQLELDFNPEKLEEENNNQNSIESSISRARNKVKILAFSNPDLVGMLTLTNKDIPSEDEAIRRFKKFREKIKKAGYTDFKFLGVKELQKRGSIHWHLLVNYCPGESPSPNNPKKRISSLWTYGYSDFVLIKGDEKWKTELYLLKYMTKNHQRIFRQYYVRSRNLDEIKPELLKQSNLIPVEAENVFIANITNQFVDNFTVTDYTCHINYLNHIRSAKLCKKPQSIQEPE